MTISSLIYATILVQLNANSIKCRLDFNNCDNSPVKVQSSSNQQPFVSTIVSFDSGFHGNYSFSCGNFQSMTRLEHIFPPNVFVDLDELSRMVQDHTSSVYQRRDLCSSKYLVNI